MIENELIQIWQSSPRHEQIKFEKSKLLLEVQSSLGRFDKITGKWDFGTIGSAIVMFLILLYVAFRLPSVLAKVGVILLMLWCLFLIYVVLRLKRTKPNEASSYLDYLKQHRQYLKNHIRLSNGFMVLTVFPCFGGVALVMIGKLNLWNKSWSEIAGTKMVWIQFSIFMLVGIVAYAMNKWVAKREFLPRLQKVNKLLALLKEDQ
ncbi:hypothetical protein MTsPCn5_03980 [Croceitalea sp. MTPC5]|uniref:hypothetical protein n=1 Tax=Croceitalea sp. MTPC5 TaxID=3056565 RepID=UPI002B3B87C2|nr:hypothetical protein MTsPCn5_03980 [Croceitalea sp. MTPC5]